MSLSSKANIPPGYRHFRTLAMLYVASLLVTNTIAVKIFAFCGLMLPAGVLTFPLAYLGGDIFTEVYGFRKTCALIWGGFFCMAGMSFFYWAASQLPPAPSFVEQNAAFIHFFCFIPRLVFASLISYLIGEFLNSMIISFLKVKMKGSHFWLRVVFSTIISQGADSLIFCLVAFTGIYPLTTVAYLSFSIFVFKTLYEIIALPITCKLAPWLKRAEGIDTYDYGISYNPFKT